METTEPMITLTQSALHKMHTERDKAWAKVTELEKLLEEERAKIPDERFAHTATLLEVLKEIADHAIANLHPEFIKDLPMEAFLVAGAALPDSLGAKQRDHERAAVWLERARLIQEWRDKRKSRGFDDVPPAPTKPKRGRPPKGAAPVGRPVGRPPKKRVPRR